VRARKRQALEGGDLLGVMFTWAARPALVVALITVVGVTIVTGWAGFVGGLVAVTIVVLFFGVDLLVLHFTKAASPGQVSAVVLGEYVVKILLLAVLVWWLQKQSWIDLHSMAVTVVTTTVAWIVALTVAAFRARSFVIDPPSPQPDRDAQTPAEQA
jgi:ATP synthase protein I